MKISPYDTDIVLIELRNGQQFFLRENKESNIEIFRSCANGGEQFSMLTDDAPDTSFPRLCADKLKIFTD